MLNYNQPTKKYKFWGLLLYHPINWSGPNSKQQSRPLADTYTPNFVWSSTPFENKGQIWHARGNHDKFYRDRCILWYITTQIWTILEIPGAPVPISKFGTQKQTPMYINVANFVRIGSFYRPRKANPPNLPLFQIWNPVVAPPSSIET